MSRDTPTHTTANLTDLSMSGTVFFFFTQRMTPLVWSGADFLFGWVFEQLSAAYIGWLGDFIVSQDVRQIKLEVGG